MALPPLQYQTITNYAPAIRGSGNQVAVGTETVETVKNWLGARVIAAVSSYQGTPAMRLIPNSTTNNESYAKFDLPVAIQDAGYFRATVITEAALTGSLGPHRGMIGVVTPEQYSSAAPNTPGVYDLSFTYGPTTTVPLEARVFHGGLQGAGDVTFTNIGIFTDAYDGPVFDGDTEPFFYRDQVVYPKWDGIPGESTSSFNFYDFSTSRPLLNWGNLNTHYYENGVDRGVLYVKNEYGVAWHGLTSVVEQSNMSDPKALFLDGTKFNQVQQNSNFSASITAYGAPDIFKKCEGVDSISNGLFVTEQRRVPFDISYRTKVGSAANSNEDHYKIHLVYNCLAVKDDITYNTVSETPEPIVHGWKLHTVPVAIFGKRATAHIVVDSRYTPTYLLKTLEDILYGSPVNEPTMPDMEDVLALFS